MEMVLGLQRGTKSPSEMGAACPVQIDWGRKLGMLAPSEMVLGLWRGTKAPRDMAEQKPGEHAVTEEVLEAAGQWPGQIF